jgi:adenylate cyclase
MGSGSETKIASASSQSGSSTWKHLGERVLREAEWRSERVLAYSRLIALVVIAAQLRFFELPDHQALYWISLAVYAAGTIGAIAAAYLSAGSRILLWILTSSDLALILYFAYMQVLHTGLTPDQAFASPTTYLIFLVFAHAVVRHRSEVIIFSTVVFVAGWAYLLVLSGHHDLGVGQVLWARHEHAVLAIVGLTAGTLIAATLGTRRLLHRAINEARLRGSLSQFVSDSLLLELSGGPLRVRRMQNVAVLFVDMRGFTTMSETMRPEELLELLNEFRSVIGAEVRAAEGTIDKFIGDAVMAVFGIPEPNSQDASRAITCALGIVRATGEWNAQRKLQDKAPILVSIGVHYGEALVGIVGDEQRLEYTVIGDTVNTAQRLERMAASSGLQVAASQEILKSAGRPPEEWRWIDSVSLRGKAQKVEVFSLTS